MAGASLVGSDSMAKERGKPSVSSQAAKPARTAPPRRRRASAAAGTLVRRHRRDIGGLAAVVLGLLVAGSVWVPAAGPLGAGIDWVLAACVGLVRAALPVGLAALGVAALMGGRRGASEPEYSDGRVPAGSGGSTRSRGGATVDADPGTHEAAAAAAEPKAPDSMARAISGGVLLLVSVSGLLHLGRGRPGIGDPIDELGAAGGALGVAAGGFLHAWTDVWGSTLLLAFIGLVGVIVATRLTVRSVAGALMAVLRPAGRGIGRGIWKLIVKLFSDIKEVPESPSQAPGPPSAHPSEPASLPGAAHPGTAHNGAARSEAAHLGTAGNGAAAHGEPAAPRRPTAPTTPEPAVKAPPNALAISESGAPASRRTVSEPGSRTDSESRWALPSATLLSGAPWRDVDQAEAAERGRLLQATLHRFGVPTHLLDPVVGPTVTRFVLELGEGVKVAKLESLRKDIAYAMASPDVRILAPIPGRRAIGVEVPNLDRQIVRLGDVLRSPEADEARHPLQVAVGRDINGHSVMMDLATTPHLLIAGATGAGKSSCLNSLITSVLMRSRPEKVKMILVDPKRVEMGQYDGVPHLLTAPVTDPRKAANALAWAVREMDRRYDLLHERGCRDIAGYNAAVDSDQTESHPARSSATEHRRRAAAGDQAESHPAAGGPGREPSKHRRMPLILVVVDELADLMMVAARDVEESIVRLAQMARAVGIHLVIATQRPSVNVITGVIKANIPARMAFAVSSLTDSRVILDQAGAERLVGRGDLLLLDPSSSVPQRIQGCWVTEAEVREVVKHWVSQKREVPDDPMVVDDDSASDTGPGAGAGAGASPAPGISPAPAVSPTSAPVPAELDLGGAPAMLSSITDAPPPADDGGDALLDAAMALVVETQLGSTSMLQRRLRVGFARAGRIMDLLEQRGVVGPSTGSKAREVLVSPDEFEQRRAG